MKLSVTILILTVVSYRTYGQYIPQTPLPGGNSAAKPSGGSNGGGGSGTCQYTFNVPDPKGACAGTSNLDKKLDAVKQDLDKTRFQYVSQNSLIQSTLAKIQSDTSNYMSKVSDLSNELQKIKQSVSTTSSPSSSSQGSGNPNSQYLNQIVHDTQDLLNKAIHDINNKIFNVTQEMQRSAVEESKVQSAIEKQINQQTAQIATAEQKLISLENLLKNMNTQSQGPVTTNIVPTGAGPTVSSVLINQLQNQLNKLEGDVKSTEQAQATEFKSLNDKTNQILTELNNQSHQIDNAVVATQASFQRISSIEKDVQDAKDNLTQVEKRYDPQITIMLQEISSVNKNMSRLETELKQTGSFLLQNKVMNIQQRKQISDLDTKAKALTTDVHQMTSDLATQTNELLSLKVTLNSLQGGSFNGSGSGNSSAVTQLINQVKSKIQQDVNTTRSDLSGLQKIVFTLMKQVSTLAVSCG